MRISDWSSDVCSSDLLRVQHPGMDVGAEAAAGAERRRQYGDGIEWRLGDRAQAGVGRHRGIAVAAVVEVAALAEVAIAACGGKAVESLDCRLQRGRRDADLRSEEHTTEPQSLMR